MAQVEAEAQGRAFSVLLQNAETVRLVAAPPPKGRSGDFDGPAQAISVSALKPGDVVLAHVPETVARHTGLAVEETIVERRAVPRAPARTLLSAPSGAVPLSSPWDSCRFLLH